MAGWRTAANETGREFGKPRYRDALQVMGVSAVKSRFAGLARMGYVARGSVYLVVGGLAVLATWFNSVCRFGLIARGIVLCIVGAFVMQSAWRARFGELRGMEVALDALRSTAFGTWLLGIVAAGLFAFGLYSLIEAVYRRVDPALDRTHRRQTPQ